jgi:hypothetical protein
MCGIKKVALGFNAPLAPIYPIADAKEMNERGKLTRSDDIKQGAIEEKNRQGCAMCGQKVS